MPIEKVSWISDELKICGQVYVPEINRGPYPGLIICHGLPGKLRTPDDKGYPFLADYFCREGFLVLIFNFRGTGLSEGNFDILGWTRDLERGLEFIVTHPEVEVNNLLLMGFSAGAAVAIYVAAKRQEIKAIISCASPANFKELETEEGRIDFLKYAREVGIIKSEFSPTSLPEWGLGFRLIKPSFWIKMIPPRPLLILHGEDDEVVEVRHAHELYEQVEGQADLLLFPEAGHRLRLQEAAMKEALLWAKKIAFFAQK